jgi:hypothetical protein
MPPRLPMASMPPSPPAAASCPRSALVRAIFMWNLWAARVSLPLDACALPVSPVSASQTHAYTVKAILPLRILFQPFSHPQSSLAYAPRRGARRG